MTRTREQREQIVDRLIDISSTAMSGACIAIQALPEDVISAFLTMTKRACILAIEMGYPQDAVLGYLDQLRTSIETHPFVTPKGKVN